ncbi:MAG: hypothetical protein JSS54_15870 [Proteobacteria bacterium]|nr:hypothetical protein [Pseudomonadota bacterium]
MGTTLPQSIIYETADARSVEREVPSLEMLKNMSFFAVLVISPSLFGNESAWQKEADDFRRAADDAERQAHGASSP